MIRLIAAFCVIVGGALATVGCAGEYAYTIFEEVSASEFQADESPSQAAEAPAPVGAEAAPGAADTAANATGGVDSTGGLAGEGAPPAAPGLQAAPEANLPVAPPAGASPAMTRLINAGGPVRLEIAAIGVDAQIEHVGLTPEPEKAMDVPKAWMNTAWYNKGYLPGEPGNAVVAGHLDSSTGGPAVFWDLDKLNVGDEVVVTYANGDRYTFMVEDWKLYDHNAQGSIIDSIFGKSQTSDLNLVTCDGAWDHGAATYSKRLVVFTTLVPEKTVWAEVQDVMQ